MHNLPSRSSVAITVPASPAHLRHLRVLTSTAADDVGFAVDAIESLRVAVDELCALAMSDADDDATLTLTIVSERGALALAGTCGPVADDPVLDPIAEQLIDAGSTSHSMRRDGDDCVFDLRAELASTDGS